MTESMSLAIILLFGRTNKPTDPFFAYVARCDVKPSTTRMFSHLVQIKDKISSAIILVAQDLSPKLILLVNGAPAYFCQKIIVKLSQSVNS